MSTIANYPDGIGTAGPTIARIVPLPTDYTVDRSVNEDGGCNVNVQPCGLKRFQLEYAGLSAGDLATLRTHKNLAKGRVNDFSFYYRENATTYTGVMYESWKVGRHVKTWARVVSVVLVVYQ